MIQPFHLMVKPAGPGCNLACEYCYYLEKSELYPGSGMRMDLETLERVTAAYLGVHPGPEVVFGWQGGEPLLMGLEFFEKALEFQAQYIRPGQTVLNTLQTNGTLVNDDWAAFFAKHKFLVGISIDGPANLHDRYRRSRGGNPSHEQVLAGLERLKQHGAEFNALVTVNRANSRHPLRVYRYLTGLGLDYLQFIPIVERKSPAGSEVTDWSVRPDAYGRFLCEVFDYWSRHDVGRVFVQIFESALSVWMGAPPTICVFGPTCGRALVAEHNGDLYACDHYVYPGHLRGKIASAEALEALVDGPEQRAFGAAKANLPDECLECSALALCGGDCPKHRIVPTASGPAISYLCAAYREFFNYSAPALEAMAEQIHAGHGSASITDAIRR